MTLGGCAGIGIQGTFTKQILFIMCIDLVTNVHDHFPLKGHLKYLKIYEKPKFVENFYLLALQQMSVGLSEPNPYGLKDVMPLLSLRNSLVQHPWLKYSQSDV